MQSLVGHALFCQTRYSHVVDEILFGGFLQEISNVIIIWEPIKMLIDLHLYT